MKKVCVSLVLLMSTFFLYGQEIRQVIVPVNMQLAEVSDSIMRKIFARDYAGAISIVRKATSIAEPDLLTLHADFEEQSSIITSAYGNPLDIHLFREKTVGDVLVQLEYIERFERHFLHFSFQFFRGKSGWVVAGLVFDDSIDTVF